MTSWNNSKPRRTPTQDVYGSNPSACGRKPKVMDDMISALRRQFYKPDVPEGQGGYFFFYNSFFFGLQKRIDCSSSSYLCKAPIASTRISNSCEPAHQHVTQHHRSPGSYEAGRQHEQIVQIGRNRRHMDVGIAEAGNHVRSMHVDRLLHPATHLHNQSGCMIGEMNRLSFRNNRLKFKTAEILPIIVEDLENIP